MSPFAPDIAGRHRRRRGLTALLLLVLLGASATPARADDSCATAIHNLEQRLEALAPPLDPSPAQAKRMVAIAHGKSSLMTEGGMAEMWLHEPKAGGMNVAFELKTPPGSKTATFPKSSHIPAELHGKPIDGWMVKIQQEEVSATMLARDHEALKDLPGALKGKNGIDMVETHVTTLPSGKRVIFQQKAPGTKVTDVLGDLCGSSLGTTAKEPERRMLLAKLMNEKYEPCFGPSGMLLKDLCGDMIKAGFDLPALGTKLKSAPVVDLRAKLRELRLISEGKTAGMEKITATTSSAGMSNRLFWMEERGGISTLDMSVDNFNVEMVGGHAKIHIFDF